MVKIVESKNNVTTIPFTHSELISIVQKYQDGETYEDDLIVKLALSHITVLEYVSLHAAPKRRFRFWKR